MSARCGTIDLQHPLNGPTVYDEAQTPFGGEKDSGYGRSGGKAAINEFTELRWITIQSGHRHFPVLVVRGSADAP